MLLAVFTSVLLVSVNVSQKPGDLGLTFRECNNALCVAWVMPAGQAWHDGARPGMRVISLNGNEVSAATALHSLVEAELLSPDGGTLIVRVLQGSITHPGASFSLWLTGTIFALFGAVVLVRRPDAAVARFFALFAVFTGVALVVAPAAAGPQPSWALVIQFLSLLVVASFLPAFTAAFVGEWRRRMSILWLHWLVGSIALTTYAIAVFINPWLYAIVRPAFLLYLLAGIVSSLGLLVSGAFFRGSSAAARDARIALSGIACGTLPFACLTVIPQAMGRHDLVPAHHTAILWCIIPVTLAYAILRHHALGIRRLVHRGMVHGLAAGVLFVSMLMMVVAASSIISRRPDPPHPMVTSAALFALAAVLFHISRRGVRSLLDRWFQAGDMDSGALLAGMRHDLVDRERAQDLVSIMVRRLVESMRLEAASLFLGAPGGTLLVTASAGTRAEEAIAFIGPRIEGLFFDREDLAEMRWESDVLLVARLGTDAPGYLVLGPKERGEVFLREERQSIEAIAPILALAIRETTLLADLRDVNERLTNAEEAERARLARDLHDGPLQKAILLGAGDDVLLRNRDGVARDLASELRELCARLRPAILDDLGLVPAIEWLLEKTAQGFTVTPRLTLRGITEDDRLEPNAELALFRVTQEAVSNALKHAHAASIHVSLAKTHDEVQLSVADDGRGLPSAGPVSRGLGIPGMRERLRQVGGVFHVSSTGTGTMVTARIPNPNQRPQ